MSGVMPFTGHMPQNNAAECYLADYAGAVRSVRQACSISTGTPSTAVKANGLLITC
ncbi:hypothetical protein KCP70_05445 [Salmonella enterica subsp. enterica]|nr:hypothetical protein KCP70_05445 [Salmonella enterica subsp. enterica]